VGQLKREQLGNAATEQGAALDGADFGQMNTAELPEGRPDPVEVDAEYVAGDGLTLTPKSYFIPAESNGYGKVERQIAGNPIPFSPVLHEGPLDLLNAQLCEEPGPPESTGLAVQRIGDIEVEANPRRLSEITKRSPREELVWYGMHPEYYGAASGDRVILRRDILESQYSCKACKGNGFEEEALCALCGGLAKEKISPRPGSFEMQEVPCRGCRVIGFGKETGYSCGHKKCSKCNGSGWKGGIVIPEESQTQAITGVVVSVGPLVDMWKIGDRLVFSRYAGHTLTVSKTEDYIWMHQTEPIGILRQRGDRP
jgi:co-chaperonin GroES (HSP10)